MARMIQRNDYVDVFAIETRNDFVYDDYAKVSYKYSNMYPFVDCKFMDTLTKCPINSTAVLMGRYQYLKPICECVDGQWTPDSW